MQLVSGKNTNLPSAVNDHLPASEWYIKSTDLAHQVIKASAVLAVIKACVISKSSKKFKLALKKKIRNLQIFLV